MTASSRRRLKPRNLTLPTVTPTSTSCTPCSLPILWRAVSLYRGSPTPPRSRPWGRTRPSTWRSRWTPCFSTSTEPSGLSQGCRSTSVLPGCRRATRTNVTKFREGTRSLGAVVKELMASRDAHWLPHVVSDNQSVAAPVVTPNPAGAAPKPASESKFLPGPVINGRPTAKQMKDGLRLCEGFNKGTCSNKNCGNGAHRCSVILRAERVCGSPAHPAAKCKAKAKH